MRSWLSPLLVLVFVAAVHAQEAKPVDAKALRQEAQAAVQAADWGKAIAGFEQLTRLEPKNGANWHMLGYSLHAAGKLDLALQAHEKAAEFAAVKPVATYNIACVHALQGNKDKAFEFLGKAIDAGFAQTGQLLGDNDLDSLHADPRWQALADRVAKVEAARGAGPAAPYQVTTRRQSTRVVWFDQAGNSPGQLVVDYAPVAWQDKYEAAVDAPKHIGRHWRLGADYWTSLETMLPVRIGDLQLQPGQYFLTLIQPQAGAFMLAVHDANEVRKLHLDAYLAHQVPAGKQVALAHSRLERKAEQLEIAIQLDGGKPEGELAIRFGGHQLTVKLAIQVP